MRIRLHRKLGLNPKIGVCLLCQEDNGEILLPGAAVKEEYPRRMMSPNPCKKCAALLQQGNVGLVNKNTLDSAIVTGEAVIRLLGEEKGRPLIGNICLTETTFWALQEKTPVAHHPSPPSD